MYKWEVWREKCQAEKRDRMRKLWWKDIGAVKQTESKINRKARIKRKKNTHTPPKKKQNQDQPNKKKNNKKHKNTQTHKPTTGVWLFEMQSCQYFFF